MELGQDIGQPDFLHRLSIHTVIAVMPVGTVIMPVVPILWAVRDIGRLVR